MKEKSRQNLDKRTEQQNRALHLWFEILSQELNFSGLDMRKTLKPSVDILWTKNSVKEYIWRPIQKSMFQKKSTTELLKKEEIDRIMDVICRHLSQKFGFTCPEFPNFEKQDFEEIHK